MYPTKRSTVITPDSSYYAGLDYDSKEEFNIFNSQLRIIVWENFRQATFIAPLVTYGYVERWLQQRMQQSMADPTPVTTSSPAYLEWAALASVGILALCLFKLRIHVCFYLFYNCLY